MTVQVINFTTGPRSRSIEQIPQVYKQEYRFNVNGREVSVYCTNLSGRWFWRTEDCRWWDWNFLSGGKGFDCYAEAAQDAVNRIGGRV